MRVQVSFTDLFRFDIPPLDQANNPLRQALVQLERHHFALPGWRNKTCVDAAESRSGGTLPGGHEYVFFELSKLVPRNDLHENVTHPKLQEVASAPRAQPSSSAFSLRLARSVPPLPRPSGSSATL